jgi:hypothetical protein
VRKWDGTITITVERSPALRTDQPSPTASQCGERRPYLSGQRHGGAAFCRKFCRRQKLGMCARTTEAGPGV